MEDKWLITYKVSKILNTAVVGCDLEIIVEEKTEVINISPEIWLEREINWFEKGVWEKCVILMVYKITQDKCHSHCELSPHC